MATTKDFDCIAFKRAAQEKIYEQIKGMTPAEEIAWFRQKVASGPYRELLQRVSARNKKPDALCCADETVDFKANKN